MVSHIHAFVRVRPLLPREFAQSTSEAVSVYEDQRIRACKDNTVLESDFDEVLGQHATQDQVFAAAQGCVDSVLEGYNGSILAYGATGSGKTFTMLGSFNENASADNAGLIPRALKDLFTKTGLLGAEDDRQHCRICMSYVEIYNERLHDLLQPYKPNARLDPQDMRKRKAGLEVKERHGQTCVPGALLVRVDTVQAALSLVRKGNLSRAVRHTEMNQHSSRSHTILQVVVEQRLRGSMLRSKLNFVDLAGSERWNEQVEMSEVRVSEMTSINQSLSTLITVVASLTEQGRSHIPYRDSKLTHLLQDSLGGNCNTTIIATISPSSLAFEETCATLKFADRARNIVNRATVNLHTDFKLELELKTAEVKRLTGLLAKFASMVDSNGRIAIAGSSGGGSGDSGTVNTTGSHSMAAAAAADKHRSRSLTDPEAESEADISRVTQGAATAGQTRERPATVSSPVTEPNPDDSVSGSPSLSAMPRSSSDRVLGGYQTNPSRQASGLVSSASERALGQHDNPNRQNSSRATSANRAEVGRLRAELLLAREDLLAERAARLRLESVVVASQRYFSQRDPQPDANPYLGPRHIPAGADFGSTAAAASYGVSGAADQLPQPSSPSYMGRSSLFPSPSSSSLTSIGRSSLNWQPGAASKSHIGAQERTTALQPQAAVSFTAAMQQRYLPSEASVSSLYDAGSSTPITRGQSGSWGRSSVAHSPESPQAYTLHAPSASRHSDTAFERQAGPSHVTAGRSFLGTEASGTSSISSPYTAKFAMSPSTSKPSSPSKRNNVASSEHLLHNNGTLLKDGSSLDAGSWIYIMGSRSSSLAAKQMARSSKAAAKLT